MITVNKKRLRRNWKNRFISVSRNQSPGLMRISHKPGDVFKILAGEVSD